MKTFSENWMNYLNDDTRLTDLTIPGTHDSGTSIFSGLGKCQNLNIKNQLEAGIRFLDIRLKPGLHNDDALYIAHGTMESRVSFSSVLQLIKDFLNANKNETIFISIKDDSKTYNSQKHKEYFYNAVWKTINIYGIFYTLDKIPELTEIRGKAVLLRRFWAPDNLEFPVGIDLYYHWPTNSTEHWTNPVSKISFSVQDEYNSTTISYLSGKFNNYVKPLLDEAPTAGDRLIINFTSGVIDGGGVAWEGPIELANTTNPLLFNYLFDKEHTRFGIIPMDFPEIPENRALINRLFSCNPFHFTKLKIKEGDVIEIRTRLDLNKCLDVKGNDINNGAPIIIHTSNNQLNQKWKLEDSGNGYFYLHAQNSPNSVLDVKGLGKADGTELILQQKNGGDNQKWKITPLDNGYFTLQPKHAQNMSLDLYDAKTENGSPIKIFQSNSNDWAEQWAIFLV